MNHGLQEVCESPQFGRLPPRIRTEGCYTPKIFVALVIGQVLSSRQGRQRPDDPTDDLGLNGFTRAALRKERGTEAGAP